MFLRNCKRCDKKFRPTSAATKLCDKCWFKAQKKPKKKKE